MIKIQTPLTKDKVSKLKAGDKVLLSGTIYTARDVAHKNLCNLIEQNKELPIDINNQIIYFTGPAPAKPGEPIGSAGPTTSYRMDDYSPVLIKNGLSGMIGKGDRSAKVIDSMKEYKAIYFAAIGGAGALIAECITSSEVVAYPELGPEAIRKLSIENLPVVVAIDSFGSNLYS